MGASISPDWKIRFEELIRIGDIQAVRNELAHTRVFDVERSDIVLLATYARRVGLAELTLKLLHPIVRPEFPLKAAATPLEVATFASGLARTGALKESEELLTGLLTTGLPEVYIYLSFTYLAQWEYAKAIPHLKKYILVKSLSAYDITLAKINLAACYQFLDTHSKEKMRLLSEVTEAARNNNWKRLLSHIFELTAQAKLSSRDWPGARQALEQAYHHTHGPSLLLDKWKVILELKENGLDEKVRLNLAEIRQRAEESADWETVRDCDFYLATEAQDKDLTARLYLGTCHSSYKRRLKKVAKDWIDLPATFIWKQGHAPRIFDLTTGEEENGSATLKAGQSLLRLLQFLASDFYRSFPIGTAFAHMYPGEYFNIDSSPARVRRSVERLRDWFQESKIPLEIENKNNSLRIRFTGDYGVRISHDVIRAPAKAFHRELLLRLKKQWPYQAFSSQQAATVLEMSVDSAREILKAAHAAKKIKCSGRGRATRFHF